MLSFATEERPLLPRYRRALLRHAPPTHARMTPAGFTAKYLRADPATGAPYEAITDSDLAAHLAGDITLAAQLQRDGHSHLAACDLDTGGEAALRRVQRAAERRGCHAIAIALDAGAHDGGHVWIVFRDAHPAEDLRALMRDILADAGVHSTEVYPSGADLRLPLGLHRRAGRRGLLIASSAAPAQDIDADPRAALAAFLDACVETDAAPVARARADQQARAEAAAAQAAARADLTLPPPPGADYTTIIRAFNAATDMVQLLEAYGARVSHRYANGRVMLHCAAHQDHRNGDAHPSLMVQPGTGGQAGKVICGCFAPGCRLHNAPHQVKDVFEAYCILEGISHREGIRRQRQRLCARPHPARPAHALRPAPNQPPAPPQPPAAQQTLALAPQDVVRGPDTDDWPAQVQQRLADLQRDPRARPMDRRLYAYFAARCVSEPRCRPSNARCAAALEVPVDTIKFTKRRLRTLGYITVDISTDGRNTSVVDLLPGGVIRRSPEVLRIGFTKKGGAIPPPAAVNNRDIPHQDAENPVLPAVISPRTPSSPFPHQDTEKAAQPAPMSPRAPQPRTKAPRKPRRALRDMSPAELERERFILLAVAAKTTNERQSFVLRQKAAAVDEELTRRRVAALLARDPADDPPAAEASYHGPGDEPDDDSTYEEPPPEAPRALEAPAPSPAVTRPGDADAGMPNQCKKLEEADVSTEMLEESRAEMLEAAGQQDAEDAPYEGPPVTLAAPDAPHPPLSDAQLTAVVRRGLRAWVRSRYHLLIERIDVRQEGRALTLVVDTYQPLTGVEQELAPRMENVLRQLGLDGAFTEVRVRRGPALASPTSCPAWLPLQVWAALPIVVQAGLTGATVVGTMLYGATPYHTTLLANDRSGAVAWLLHMLSAEGLAALPPDAASCYNELDTAPEATQGCNHAKLANSASGRAKPPPGSDGITQSAV